MPTTPGTVLITGASTGIGEACTRLLAQAGYTVAAGVRRQADGERLQEINPEKIKPVLLDVTEAAQVAAAAEQVANWTGPAGLGGLLNNAGIAVGGPLEFVPLDELRRQMEVNLIGPVAVTQAFLPLLRQGGGRLIFNGSIAGVFAAPFRGPYSASKFALEAVADVLRTELRPWGLQVSIIEAGNIATPIWQRSLEEFDRSLQHYPPEAFELYGAVIEAMQAATRSKPRGISPEVFARLVLHILTTPNPKARYLLGRDALSRDLMRRLPTRLVDWLVWRKVNKR